MSGPKPLRTVVAAVIMIVAVTVVVIFVVMVPAATAVGRIVERFTVGWR